MTPYRQSFKFKPDASLYPELSQDKDWISWKNKTFAVSCAQGLGLLFQSDYIPQDAQSQQYFTDMNIWMYGMVLQHKIKTIEGRAIVESHRHDFNAQAIFTELNAHYKNSTTALIAGQQLLTKIQNVRLTPSWNRPLTEFICKWQEMVTEFNEMQPRRALDETSLQATLEAVVSGMDCLRRIKDEDMYRLVKGEPPLTYQQYLALLKAAAATYDQGKTYQTTRRHAHIHELNTDAIVETERHQEDLMLEISDYIVNEARRNTKPNASRMNRDTWKKLNPEAQKVWDTLDDKSKSLILNHAMDRAKREVNNTNIVDTDSVSDDDPSSDDTPPDDISALIVNEATSKKTTPTSTTATKAQNTGTKSSSSKSRKPLPTLLTDAHPADPRKMLSQFNVEFQTNLSDRHSPPPVLRTATEPEVTVPPTADILTPTGQHDFPLTANANGDTHEGFLQASYPKNLDTLTHSLEHCQPFGGDECLVDQTWDPLQRFAGAHLRLYRDADCLEPRSSDETESAYDNEDSDSEGSIPPLLDRREEDYVSSSDDESSDEEEEDQSEDDGSVRLQADKPSKGNGLTIFNIEATDVEDYVDTVTDDYWKDQKEQGQDFHHGDW